MDGGSIVEGAKGDKKKNEKIMRVEGPILFDCPTLPPTSFRGSFFLPKPSAGLS